MAVVKLSLYTTTCLAYILTHILQECMIGIVLADASEAKTLFKKVNGRKIDSGELSEYILH